MMVFPTQFKPNSPNSERKAILAKKYSQPVEGFQRGLCESLSRLVQRLTVGQSVPFNSGGVYVQDQIFDSEFVDQFELMDKQNELTEEIGKQRRRKAAERFKEEGQTLPGTPPSE